MSPEPYKGTRRKLVLAFDVGTTFSGISYSILDPGQIPQIYEVNRFPAQEQVTGLAKIPTVIYYDREGSPRGIGAEALTENIFELAENENWVKVEWFKLHLRPGSASTDHISDKLPPLPPNKVAIDILADFYRYLFQCARDFIQESHANGPDVWLSVKTEIHFVLSHPNGWGGAQQTLLRKAAIKGGLIPDSDSGRERISFVTEGEASLHFAIKHGLPTRATTPGDGVVIVDAGGGTIDLSVYSQGANPLKQTFEEIAQPQCHLQGSIFVSTRARDFLQGHLAQSDFYDDLDHIVTCFDKTTKLRFRDADEHKFIKFGSVRDNDPECNIRLGQLKLSGTNVSSFFEPSVRCIVEAVKEQRRSAHKNFTHVVLVGGFAASDWLYKKVSESLQPLGYTVVRPDHHVMKAVANGAISYYINHYVQTRVSGVTYGSLGKIAYDPSNLEHKLRSSKATTSASGGQEIVPYFWVILEGNKQVPESNEIRRSFHWHIANLSSLKESRDEIYSYAGNIVNGAFMDVNKEKFSKLCTIEADVSHLANSSSIETMYGPKGRYYRFSCDIVLSFGGTEIKAQLAWRENGVEKRHVFSHCQGEDRE
ncbi:hypothetical protein B0H34DRAFT_385803 [Crassisporium funariophilum]|nr:hypothetical protein B0H34DRAFT_385803 [Crassisporium funariophilum]